MSNKFKLGHPTSNNVKKFTQGQKGQYPNEGERRSNYFRMLLMPKKVKKYKLGEST
jgi:hypothetical protein